MILSLPEHLAPVLTHYGIDHRDIPGFQKVLCPVHEERRPSCSISLSTGFFECHSCGARGGALDIVMTREGLTDREAASKFCEGISGISNSGVSGSARGKSRSRISGDEAFVPRYRREPPSRVRRSKTPWV